MRKKTYLKKNYDLPLKILTKIVRLRNVETTGLNKSELLYILMRTQKHHKEKEYLSLLQTVSNNEIKSKTNEIRKVIIELDMLLNKSDRDIIRKILEKIDKETPNRTQKRRSLEELNNISYLILNLKRVTSMLHTIVLVIMV